MKFDFRWLQQQATVVTTEPDSSPENLIVHVHISQANYARFQAYFGQKQQKVTGWHNYDMDISWKLNVFSKFLL